MSKRKLGPKLSRTHIVTSKSGGFGFATSHRKSKGYGVTSGSSTGRKVKRGKS